MLWFPDPVSISLTDGQTWQMLMNMRTWYHFETRTNVPLAKAGSKFSAMRAILWALLFEAQPSVTETSIGKLSQEDIRRLTQGAILAFKAALPARQEAEAVPADSEEPNEPAVLNWLEVAALAHYDLRLSRDEFMGITPRFMAALVDRHMEYVERHFAGFSLVATEVRNVNLDPEKTEPLHPLFYSPTKLGAQVRRERAMQHHRDLRAKIMGLREIFPGAH